MSALGPTDDFGRPLTMWGVLALVALETSDEIGHKCGVHDCMEIAAWLAPWPGREASPRCERHYEWTLHVAGTFAMADMIQAGARPLDVKLRNPPVVDPTAERFAAMELT